MARVSLLTLLACLSVGFLSAQTASAAVVHSPLQRAGWAVGVGTSTAWGLDVVRTTLVLVPTETPTFSLLPTTPSRELATALKGPRPHAARVHASRTGRTALLVQARGPSSPLLATTPRVPALGQRLAESRPDELLIGIARVRCDACVASARTAKQAQDLLALAAAEAPPPLDQEPGPVDDEPQTREGRALPYELQTLDIHALTTLAVGPTTLKVTSVRPFSLLFRARF